ncbi:hypothetical protein BGZ68_002997 [Mortierella alpina]|nr:hypothetical protein BGZ68_002997 [Mortierella alpina]
MAANVFAVPELAAMVAQYLPPRDIAACRLTSRAFNNTFNPYLWKHTSVTNDEDNEWDIFYRASTSEFLYRNRQYIETLSLEIFAAQYLQTLLNTTSADDVPLAPPAPAQKSAGTPQHPGFPSLKFLSIAVGAIKYYSQLAEKDAVIPDDSLKILLEEAPNITSLTLYPEVLENPNFMATLKSGLPHLKTLILRRASDTYKPYPIGLVLSALPILLAKPKLTTLELDFFLKYDPEVSSSTLVGKTMKDLAENPRAKLVITSMVFPRTEYGFPLTFVKPMLETCLPQLQILNVPFLGARDLAQLVDVVPAHCPNVRELNLSRLRSGSEYPEMIEQVVRLIKSYKDLRAYHGPAYEEWEDRRAITQALLEHTNTLESVVLTEEMNSSAFANLLSSMPALRTLVIIYTFSVDLEGAISRPWAPRHLQRLDMTVQVKDTTLRFVKSQCLDRDPEFNPGLLTEKLDDQDFGYMAMRKLFKNIGELTELEDLYIRHYYNSKWKCEKDWTLGVGLGFLGGLVKLRKLRLNDGVEYMGQAEMEFIYKHWPNLEEVDISIESKYPSY